MNDPLVPAGDGHTELAEEDRDGLIPSYIATRADLFDAEQRNITTGLLRRRPTALQLLDEQYLRDLHRAMFGAVWAWAGEYRRSDTNIGIPFYQVAGAVHDLVADVRYWVEHVVFDADEIAVRFHHRLVAIHPFPNGNGRHGRAAADLLVQALGQPRFTWGASSVTDTDSLRRAYRDALVAADDGDIEPLLAFARN